MPIYYQEILRQTSVAELNNPVQVLSKFLRLCRDLMLISPTNFWNKNNQVLAFINELAALLQDRQEFAVCHDFLILNSALLTANRELNHLFSTFFSYYPEHIPQQIKEILNYNLDWVERCCLQTSEAYLKQLAISRDMEFRSHACETLLMTFNLVTAEKYAEIFDTMLAILSDPDDGFLVKVAICKILPKIMEYLPAEHQQKSINILLSLLDKAETLSHLSLINTLGILGKSQKPLVKASITDALTKLIDQHHHNTAFVIIGTDALVSIKGASIPLAVLDASELIVHTTKYHAGQLDSSVHPFHTLKTVRLPADHFFPDNGLSDEDTMNFIRSQVLTEQEITPAVFKTLLQFYLTSDIHNLIAVPDLASPLRTLRV